MLYVIDHLMIPLLAYSIRIFITVVMSDIHMYIGGMNITIQSTKNILLLRYELAILC